MELEYELFRYFSNNVVSNEIEIPSVINYEPKGTQFFVESSTLHPIFARVERAAAFEVHQQLTSTTISGFGLKVAVEYS